MTLTVQLRNTLLMRQCVDQGADPGNIPILYECHFQQPQVRRGHKGKNSTEIIINHHLKS